MVNYKLSVFHGHKEAEHTIFWDHDFDL